MNRVLVGAALALVLFGTNEAYAGAHAPNRNAPDFAARCQSLAQQWTDAEGTHASNANLGQAKARARTAAKDCASTLPAEQSAGMNQYVTALKLLGVTPK